jgi:gamma-glutamylcysteine synthetase
MRSEIWRDTDKAALRHACLRLRRRHVGFEGYVDWALDVPMYFVKRGDTYHDVAGAVVPRPARRANCRVCRASARRFPTGPTISRRCSPMYA